jgi:hypothetical protein
VTCIAALIRTPLNADEHCLAEIFAVAVWDEGLAAY